ncbi:hypothetical protein [Actinacidiphila acidipaludis]|uniref:Uncharacterized protein n=1 Tax=Actinacidiphila acidipaludis TaxID=2873382 RepID=A0ABS7Q2L1_9ACTN|nr:hypothetical protein [Streptomyces acidipaludis]MBY8877378.1 hypothetical protein [Streptomyces acidipaludis]
MEGYVHGTHVGTFYEAWNSCTSQVYAEFHFASTTQARAFDGSSVIGIMHSGHDYPWALNKNGGSVWWESQFPSIYSDPRSDRRYDAYITITNNGITVCTGWAGWDFSGHQIAPTWISCG